MVVKDLPRPNPFISFCFDSDFIYVGLHPKHVSTFYRLALQHKDHALHQFMDEHAKLVNLGHRIGSYKDREISEFYFRKDLLSTFTKLVKDVFIVVQQSKESLRELFVE